MKRYAYKCEQHTDRSGTRSLLVWRRELLERRGDSVRLGGVERCTIVDGDRTPWEREGGILAMPTKTTLGGLKASGYSTTPPRGLAA